MSIGKVIDDIQTKVNTNVVVQIQSYGRVFVYDQLGEIITQDEAICTYRKDGETTDDMIERALLYLWNKTC